ncbi:fasciclin domain-containing protein [Oryzobacter terrae]|uniref:fasciclin domain-containing protein n=1 Tax=Oryzobacter terrae TaxID=1620385 RepID=UPI00366ED1B0
MRRTLSTVSVIGLALVLAACGSDDADPAASTTTSASATATPSESPSASPSASASGDVVDTAVAAGGFTTLAAALEAAGLVETLKGAGPFTVFAPTDEAFAALPAGTVDTLLKDPKGDLTQILTYHVVPGKVLAADVVGLDGQKVKTVQGAELTVGVDGSAVTLTDAAGATVSVTQTDIEATNGVIHVIDGVLMPTS